MPLIEEELGVVWPSPGFRPQALSDPRDADELEVVMISLLMVAEGLCFLKVS